MSHNVTLVAFYNDARDREFANVVGSVLIPYVEFLRDLLY